MLNGEASHWAATKGVTRTCKHLKEYLGEAFEAARVRPPGGCDAGGLEPGDFFSPTKGKGKGKGKASADSPGATPEKDSELGKRITKMVALANSWDKQVRCSSTPTPLAPVQAYSQRPGVVPQRAFS